MNKLLDKTKKDIYLILIFAVVFNFIALSPLVGGKEPYGGDNSYHLTNVIFMKEVIYKDPINILDPWWHHWSMGFPIAHYYHYFSWFIMAIIGAALPFLPPYTLYNFSLVALFSLFPLSVYRGLRLMGFNRLIALFSGLLSTTVQTNLSYGMVLSSYLHYGVYAQLWAMAVFPLTIAYLYRSIVNKNGYLVSAVLLALTTILNSIIGFIAAVTALVFIFQKVDLLNLRFKPEFKTQCKVFAVILVLAATLLSFWAIPMTMNQDFNGREPFMKKEHIDSFGYNKIVEALTTGHLLDNKRDFPILSLLLLIGIGFAIKRGDKTYGVALISFLVWLLIFFGLPATFQFLRKILFIEMMPFHRAVFGVQYFAVVLGGIGLYELLKTNDLDLPDVNIYPILLRLVLIITIFIFLFSWRFGVVRSQAKTLSDYKTDESYREDLLACHDFLSGLPDGRIYIKKDTGHGTHWALGLTPTYSHKPVLVGYSSAAGLESLNFYYQEKSSRSHKKFYDMFNLKYIVADKNYTAPPFAKKIHASGLFYVYGVDTPGYFDLVEADILLLGIPIAMRPVTTAWMKSRLPENKKFMVVSKDTSRTDQFENFILPNKDGAIETLKLKGLDKPERITQPFSIFSRYKLPGKSNLGSVLREERGLNRFVAEVEVNKPSYLLLRTSYHPNWRVLVDGIKTDTDMLSPAFIGVKLDKGRHTVTFRYRTGALKWGLFLGGLLIFFLLWIRKDHDRLLNGIFLESPRAGKIIFASITLLAISSLWLVPWSQRMKMGRMERGEAYLSNYNLYGKEPGTYYLSDLKPISAKQDDGTLGFDKTYQRHIISLDGVAYEKGLGTQSNSEVIYNAEDFTEFKALIGLDDELDNIRPSFSSVVFKVYLDNVLVFESDIFYQDTPPQEINIPLKDAKKIKLVVTDAGHGSPDGNLLWGDHADWADVRFTKSEK
ncbi:MAG: NPCBM/NEW2 domain-containing protein [Candidatus Omnitrophica bacterium]|nr:NPCBM/NEW2 domain-containing protein [Candidatus Omnitrophota bacterium]